MTNYLGSKGAGNQRVILRQRVFGRLLGFAGLALCAALTLFSGPVLAQAKDGLPPILDRELFFGDPEISGAQISPDGAYIAFLKPFKGTRNIWVKKTADPFDKAKPLTADTSRPIRGLFWTRDGKFILYNQDKGGDENFNIYAVNPAETPAAGQEVPQARNLTDLKGVRVIIYSVPKNDPDAMFIGLNDRDAAWHDLYKLKISTGERTLIRKNTDRLTAWFFDLKDNLRLATRSADNGDTEILRVDPDGFKKIRSCGIFETCFPVRFHKDGKQVYLLSNVGESTDLLGLTLFDLETGKETLVESDPLKRVDLQGPIFSNVTNELVATSYDDDRIRVYWRDKSFEADYKLLEKKLPGKDLNFGSGTDDERLWLVSAGSDTEPGERYLFDRKTKALTFQYRAFEKIPREHLASMKAVRYPSSDGLEIPAYLTLPKGVPAKNLPVIIHPHGGPWARDSWGYNPYVQFFANRGYAVLQPNFRASTGFGKKFLNAGNKQWGEKMQDDITWGVKYLVAQGIVDPKRVGILGGSYGGYATLAGVAFTPDVYAAGVSIVGPSNLLTLLDSIPPYWEAGRKIFHERMGDPTNPEGKARLERQSPLNSADKIKTPLLVVQGANDPRVKKAESDQIVVALRERGFPVEYICAPDEGHGFARPVNNMAMLAQTEAFLAKYLGGRFQESLKDEVANRLREIRVNVKEVKLAPKVAVGAIGTPTPATDLKPQTVAYKAEINFGSQKINLDIQIDVKEENGQWLVTETAKTPMGDTVDSAKLEKGSLIQLKRVIKLPNIVFDTAVTEGKLTGQMQINGRSDPINVDLGGNLFADGAGMSLVVASLPLADGYLTFYRNINMQTLKPEIKQLRVSGSETIQFAGKETDTFKVDITGADGGGGTMTLWVAKDTHRVLRMKSVKPEMGNAALTSELVP
ncbi:MAG: S9 family peptidase [Blastocatellia bacterium]|nr:S9 family peptidase [Blastocatellia bacterium]